MGISVGIDFGTTSSSAVIFVDGKQFNCGDSEGFPIPSIVAIDKETGDVYTGREAWEKKSSLQESCECISSIKSILEKDFCMEIAGKQWTSLDIVTEIFHTLKIRIEQFHPDIKEVTLAIPVGFSAGKRKKLRIAAQNAGLSIKTFVTESTAAFFANYDALKNDSMIAVFDWGGGTQDVTILKHADGKVVELASAGNNRAGDEIDECLARRMHAKFARKKDKSIAFEDMSSNARDLLLVNCEAAKRNLSDDDTVTINIPRYGELGVCRDTLEYEWFCDIIKENIENAIACFEKAVEESGVGISNIDKILMVGGSTNLRPLEERMCELYGEDKVYYPETDTMWNISTGAAILDSLSGGYHSSQSVGIVLSDNTYYELLPKDTNLNGWRTEAYFGIVDTTGQARFVFGGSRDIEKAPDRFKTLEVPSYSFLEEKIKLEAEVDQDMIFRITAKSNMRTDKQRTVWEYPKLKCYYKLTREIEGLSKDDMK